MKLDTDGPAKKTETVCSSGNSNLALYFGGPAAGGGRQVHQGCYFCWREHVALLFWKLTLGREGSSVAPNFANNRIAADREAGCCNPVIGGLGTTFGTTRRAHDSSRQSLWGL